MSASWWRITAHCDPAASDALAAFLVQATGQGVEEPAPGQVRSVAEDEGTARRVVDELVAAFPAAQADVVPLEAIDWTIHWRDGIQTRRMGRLVVTPSWLPVEAEEGQVVVTIDPESAFGNGEHGSTRVAMALLERQLTPGQSVLDFGSGSGILAIAAVALGASRAIGIEVDEETLPIAEGNARQNGVADRVTFLVGDAGELGPLAGPADLVCSNILRSVNTLLLPALRASLAPRGVAIFSGMEAGEAELFRPVLEREGWRLLDEQHDAGWWGVAAGLA